MDVCLYEKSPDLIAKSRQPKHNQWLINSKVVHQEARQQSHSRCIVESGHHRSLAASPWRQQPRLIYSDFNAQLCSAQRLSACLPSMALTASNLTVRCVAQLREVRRSRKKRWEKDVRRVTWLSPASPPAEGRLNCVCASLGVTSCEED